MVHLCFLITCSALDVWDEKEIQNIKKGGGGETRPNRPAGKFILNVPFFSFSVLFVLSGKWLESQKHLKNISGSVDSKDGVWWRLMTKALMVIF